jgi:hypothetical protein
MMLCAKNLGAIRSGASPAAASIVARDPAASAALQRLGQVIAPDMTNGRCLHSGSTVVESIAPSFRKWSAEHQSHGARFVGQKFPPPRCLDRSGIPLCFLTHGKQNHNAI